ncbi:DUF3558 domain-containing protein [Mycobacterium sp. NPDC003323]
MLGRAVMSTIAAVAVAGCAHQVAGTAQPARTVTAADDRSYGYVDNRCGLLTDGSVQDVLDADEVVRPYSGAVCQYVLSRDDATVDVTFAWFDTGTLDRERAVAVERGARVRDTVVERRPAFVAERETTGAGCAAAAAAGGGVLSWWVQVRGEVDTDPCPDAEKLLAATLRSDM